MAGTWYLVVTAGMAAIALRESGTEAQKRTYLPDIAAGDRIFSFAITEPEAGTNTLNVGTRAERDGDGYVLNGKKAWITFADRADDMILVTRTTPRDEVAKPTEGLSLFVVDMDDPGIEVSPIPKHALNYSKSCEVFIEGVHVPDAALLGEEGEGWWHLVETLNPERIGFAAGATGVAELAVSKAVDYANDREVFDAPIGTHQGVSFPITQAYTNVETARLMRQKAAWLFDEGRECGYESNVAKAAAVEAGIEAVYHAMQAFGGWGYATEYDVERWWREINLTRLAPVTQQMAYNHIAQSMGFPRSY
jgi:acyl-CoA dehydrogenase